MTFLTYILLGVMLMGIIELLWYFYPNEHSENTDMFTRVYLIMIWPVFLGLLIYNIIYKRER